MIRSFKSLSDFDQAFPDEKACVDHYRAIRWPNGMSCVHCGSMERIYTLKDNTHKCGDCRKKFSVRHGSIFGDSKLELRLWFRAVFLMTSHKKGISSCQLARDLGITQKSAWFVLHRIREATKTEEFQRPLDGTVQVDEVFLGGKEKWKHRNKRRPGMEGRGSIKSKQVVIGMLSDKGELRLKHVPGLYVNDIQDVVRTNIAPGSKIHTDEARHYVWMNSEYEHALVKHRLGQYVKDGVTTNAIEGAFGHFRRAIAGVYHKASDEHIDRYLGMFGWRWTRRNMGESERVNALLADTKGKQITYRTLIRPLPQ